MLQQLLLLPLLLLVAACLPVKHRKRFDAVRAWEEEEGLTAGQPPAGSQQRVSVSHQGGEPTRQVYQALKMRQQALLLLLCHRMVIDTAAAAAAAATLLPAAAANRSCPAAAASCCQQLQQLWVEAPPAGTKPRATTQPRLQFHRTTSAYCTTALHC